MRYLILHWTPADEAMAYAQDALAVLDAEGIWKRAGRCDGLAVLTLSGGFGRVIRWGLDGFILGEAYDQDRGAPVREVASTIDGGRPRAQALMGGVFGRYVAVRGGAHPFVLRDPSGALDCLMWRLGPLTVVASDLENLPAILRPATLRLNWDAIARGLSAPASAMTEPCLEGLAEVPPGGLQCLDSSTAPVAIWRPDAFLTRTPPGAFCDLAEALATRVDVATRALVGHRDRVVVEVSGGLDSAIIATTLGRLGLCDRVAAWVNYYADRPEGDERAYAEVVTDRCGVALTAVHMPVRALREEDFAEVAKGARPPMNALVPSRDRDMARRLRESGAEAMVSGQGGDAVFFQMPTALILADEIRRRGPVALLSPVVTDLARWLRRSSWSVATQALLGEGPLTQATVARVSSHKAREAHPWVRDASAAPPAKRIQVLGLANAHVATGACRIGAQADLLYPLTAQPVVEFCLGVPAATLTQGGRDRALARAAFADRLPAAITERRKKGELSAFHAQTVAASLDFLRPFLLEGCLCEAQVLDRRRLEAALQHERLLWRAQAGELLVAAAVEAWVRWWQRYVPDSLQSDRRGWADRYFSRNAKARV